MVKVRVYFKYYLEKSYYSKFLFGKSLQGNSDDSLPGTGYADFDVYSLLGLPPFKKGMVDEIINHPDYVSASFSIDSSAAKKFGINDPKVYMDRGVTITGCHVKIFWGHLPEILPILVESEGIEVEDLPESLKNLSFRELHFERITLGRVLRDTWSEVAKTIKYLSGRILTAARTRASGWKERVGISLKKIEEKIRNLRK